jgi:hypothetical protein
MMSNNLRIKHKFRLIKTEIISLGEDEIENNNRRERKHLQHLRVSAF